MKYNIITSNLKAEIWFMLFFAVILFGGCSGSDDNSEQEQGELISILQKNKWISRDASCGFGEYDHTWVDLESTTLYFTTSNTGIIYWSQKDYDSDLGNSHNTDYVPFKYSISGNQIEVQSDYDINYLRYSNGTLSDNSGVYQSYPMDKGDYDLIKEISPKTGKCGEELSYLYNPKTHGLSIFGSGDMDDYTSNNQPWHDLYIEEVMIEAGCTSIGKNAFTNVQHVTDVNLPSSLVSIGDNAFAGTLITEVTIPPSLKSIGASAFASCKYLKKVILDDNIEEIKEYAFEGSNISTNTLVMPKNLKKVGDMAFSSWKVTTGTLKLNENLETIGNAVFNGIKGTISIPNSVKSIGNLAFDGSFNKVVVGTGLKTLSSGAFGGSLSSGSMYVNLGVPLDIDGDVMASDNQHKWTLYVPKGSKNAYQANQYWKGFRSIVEDANLVSGNGNPEDGNGNDNNENQVGKDEKEQNAIDAKDNRRGNISSHFSGNGTKTSPYLIRNAADLRLLSDKCREGNTYKDEYFKLVSDIIINSNVTNSRGECNSSDNFERWIPIGCFKESPFCGTFDGNGHTIKGVFVNRKVRGAAGLFGYFAGNINNLTIKDSYIENIGYTAGFAGKAFYFNKYKPQIETCVNYAVIKGTDGYTGGLVGSGNYCKIFKSKNYGNISTDYFAGGIAGFIYEGGATIQDCVNYGNIIGNRTKHKPCIGGIVAVLGSSTSASYIYNSINKGNVSGNDTYEHNVSGITCLFYKGKISNCVNTGNILYDGNKGCSIISNKKEGVYSDTFYLETTGKGIGTSMTEKQMKASSFIEKLNANSKILNCSSWIVDNDGFPTLK